MFSGIGEVLARERGKIVLLAGFVLVGAIMFEAGFLQGSSLSAKPLVVERPDLSGCPGGEVAGASSESSDSAGKTVSGTKDIKDCTFVGSKNSTLYHLPTCAPAKRIKPENVVCFSSESDAQAKGYKAGCVK